MDGHTGDSATDDRRISTRSAQFLRDQDGGTGTHSTTDAGASRRADYEPSEEEARRTGVVRSFRDDMVSQSARGDDATGESARALRAAVLAEESLAEFASAARRIRGLAMLREPTVEDRRLYRRLLRASERVGPLLESFERSVRRAAEPDASLLALEGAVEAWHRGEDLEDVERWLDRSDPSQIDGSGIWSRRRHLELRVDTALERGNASRARADLEEAVETCADPALEAVLARRLAFLEHVGGASERARQRLERLRPSGEGLGGLERFLCWRDRELDELRGIWAGLDASDDSGTWSLPAGADAWEREGPGAAAEIWGEVHDESPEDRVVAELRASALEAGEEDKDLVDLLHRRLEATDDSAVKVRTLTRLGRLYEEAPGRNEAAAEVYREALEIRSDHGPAARALGRLYDRAGDWRALADLYEHELQHLAFEGRRWRHRYRLGELYEKKLDAPAEAVDHYRAVLRAKPGYPPAIKGAARTLDRLERHTELVELYLGSVTDAPSDRRKVDLLDRAATLADERLGRSDVAIGAWEEVLELDPSNPRAFAALGRLYSETEQWEQLTELNRRELEWVEDDHEAAELHVRTAEICERRLGESREAAGHFQSALSLVPDYLPALEGLGRLYVGAGRWDEVVRMTRRELEQCDDGPGVERQLVRMAELLERRLERPEEAIELYAEVLERQPTSDHVRDQLLRLQRDQENWEAVVLLLRDRARRHSGRERALALGELAVVEGWHRDRPEDAFEAYAAAVDADPDNPHWVRGIERTWAASELDAGEVADRLESYLDAPLSDGVRAVLAEILGRLREHADGSCRASRETRGMAGVDDDERRLALETAHAEVGARSDLAVSRSSSPQHPLESLARAVDRGLEGDDADVYRRHRDRVTDAEERVVLGEAEATAIGKLGNDSDHGFELVGRLQGVLRDGLDEGETGPDDEGQSPFPVARLRAVEADRRDHYRSFKRWTYDELGQRRQRDAVASRLLELAEFARRVGKSEQAREVNRQAARIAFASIQDAELAPAIDEEELVGDLRRETFERLYDSLRASRQWEVLRTALRAHVGRDGLDDERRVELFESLGEVCRDELDDIEGAIAAMTHCWQISEEPTYLTTLVELDLRADALEDAIRHQRRHFEATMRREADESEVADSGVRLAELLARTEDRQDDAVGILETLVATLAEEEPLRRVRRELAYAYLDRGEHQRAAESFLAYLGNQVEERDRDEWRELVRIYDRELDEVAMAYDLQWKIVDAEPSSRRALDRLVDLAHRAGALESCVDRLEDEAGDRAPEARDAMLERAATSAEEDLREPTRADAMYARMLKHADDENRVTDLLRRRTLCLVQAMGREDDALDVFGRLLEHEAFDATVYRAMVPFFERQQSYDRARLTRQLLDALDCDVERHGVRRKTTPARAFPDDVIDGLLVPDRMPGPVFRMLRQLDPLAQKVFSVEPEPTSELAGFVPERRLDLVDKSLDDAASGLGLGRCRLVVGDEGPAQPVVDPGRRPTIRMQRGLFESASDAELKFAIGYACALGWAQTMSLFDLEPAHLWHLAEAVFLHQKGEPIDDEARAASREVADAIGSPLLTMARRRAVGPVERAAELLPDESPSQWRSGVREFAARAGLVLSGDLGAAVRCLARFEEPAGTAPVDWCERIDDQELASRLVHFAYTDDYLRARYEVGLCGQPTGVSI